MSPRKGPRVGDSGHVSFLLLRPRVVGDELVVVARDDQGRVTESYTLPRTDGTEESGETDCHAGTIADIDGDGTLVIGGYNRRGEPRQWRGVVPGTLPKARDADPAGHVFHARDDCPEGR